MRYGMPGRSLWAVVPHGRMTRSCAFSRVVRRYSRRRLAQPPAARAVFHLEVIAADIPFATGSCAVFPGMPDQADDTWPALECKAKYISAQQITITR